MSIFKDWLDVEAMTCILRWQRLQEVWGSVLALRWRSAEPVYSVQHVGQGLPAHAELGDWCVALEEELKDFVRNSEHSEGTCELKDSSK